MLGAEFSGANLFAGILFAGVGFAAFIYGKKQSSFKKMVIGGLLLVYPLLITNTIVMYVIGIGLTISLFLLED